MCHTVLRPHNHDHLFAQHALPFPQYSQLYVRFGLVHTRLHHHLGRGPVDIFLEAYEVPVSIETSGLIRVVIPAHDIFAAPLECTQWTGFMERSLKRWVSSAAIPTNWQSVWELIMGYFGLSFWNLKMWLRSDGVRCRQR